MHIAKRDIHGKVITIETGRIAKQAGGSVVIRQGDTMVLVTACCGGVRPGTDFLPLTIDYVEKQYAAGKIPGGFFKREGKLSEHETLVSRLIDRPCRPLFPEGFHNDIQVIATVISADGENDPGVLAVVGASTALTLSEMPFEGPIACVRVGRVKGKLCINPTATELTRSDINIVVAGSRDAIVMVEGGAQEVAEADLLEALFFAHAELQPLIEMQLELQKVAGHKKMVTPPAPTETDFEKQVATWLKPKIDKVIRIADKLERRDATKVVKTEMDAQFIKAGDAEAESKKKLAGKAFENLHYQMVRDMVFKEGKRIDGRDTKTVRPIAVEVGLLPRTHGSALFTRGETQAIVITTLGTMDEAQRLDNLLGEGGTKSFMLHYNFPPFSVGETKPMRGPGRREVGHGALAERAVKAVMPSETDFPYCVRIVSEITESNGSSSMASVCGSSLALMDAGVPIKAPVAGVAMGLMKEGAQSVVLTDILGDEDHLGDMDFKVCGTGKGVTAIQMDIKIKGLDRGIMGTALDQAREARLHILQKMGETINAARTKFSDYAPKIVTLKINPEKIRDVIGPGGKMIRSITESCGVKIEVTDDGLVKVASSDNQKIESALAIIRNLTEEAVVGKIYKGIVKRIADFGAFVEILPGTDGLVHISQLSDENVRRVTDIVREGDEVHVKVLEVDRMGKIRLSLREAIHDMKKQGNAA